MRALQAIVFDFDGVISDSEALHLRAYQEVLAPRGLSLSPEEYYQEYIGYHDKGVVERYASNRQLRWDEATMNQLVDEKSRRYEELSGRGDLEAFAILSATAEAPIERERTVAIEDSLGGLESARAAALRLVGVANTYSADSIEPAAEMVVSGLDSLTLSALDGLCAELMRTNRPVLNGRS